MLTIDEKLTLLNSNHPSVPRLSLPAASLGTEALHGLGIASNPNSGAFMPMSTQFPQVFGLGESWDPEATRTVGATTGYEARAYNARGVSDTGRGISVIMRGPNVDLVHDPRWGRTEESFGEDPYLVGEMAKGYLAGLHGDDPNYLLGACTLKHFAANSNETTRLTSSSNLDARNMHEYYLATFRTAVVEGRADGIMTAYNQINGIPAGTSPILKSIVRGAWGFDGFFSTDGQAATHWVEDQHYYPTIEQAIGSGHLDRQQRRAAAEQRRADRQQRVRDGPDHGGGRRRRHRVGAARPLPHRRFRSAVLRPVQADPGDGDAVGDARGGGERAGGDAQDDRVAQERKRRPPPRSNVVEQHRRDRPARRLRRARLVRRDARLPVRDRAPGDQQQARARGGGHLRAERQRRRRDVPPPPCRTWRWCLSATTRPAAARPIPRGEPARQPTRGASRSTASTSASSLHSWRWCKSVAAVNPRTIVVLVSSFPIAIGWINDNVPAIVHVANSGQELGNAVADVLFGDYNPGGRTSTTWYQSETDIPTAITDYDIKQGTTYWYFTGTPLYPFGHGLSYATFAYSNLTLSAPSMPACGTVEVSVDVTNTAAVAGDEVVQLYVAHPDSAVARPLQRLRGFRRVHIAPGATAHISMPLGPADLSYFEEGVGQFVVERGKSVELQIGASSRDIRLRAMLAVTP